MLPGRSSGASLGLLGGFELRLDGRSVLLPRRAKRLLVFLALRHRPVSRPYVCQSLWLDSTERHADGNLRSALWKVGQLTTPLIDQHGGQLALGETVAVDYVRSTTLARSLIRDAPSIEESELDVEVLTEELLPDWFEEWVLPERERYRQLRLHALECLCEHLVSLGRLGQAIQAGLAAVSGEPLRESANMALIRAYVAEGNVIEAIRHYSSYQTVLQEIGVRPSAAMDQVIKNLTDR